ncbi:hypothetical protein LCGC14_0625870 [marine sediment metagenome]|uniref:Terminase large subunit gp17-like C-terminal domain-containing protein n=1 Tax=marine sediment metagenome TaxID=412755 RepID=A0A0F9UBW6_9ZZZZ
MKYTEIPEDFKIEYQKKFIGRCNREINELAIADPTIFAYYFLDIKLRIHQAYALHKIITSKTKRIALCWARQLGKSIGLGVFLIWAVWFNKYPSTVANITTAYIISTNDEASVELLSKIRDIFYQADVHMGKVTAGTKAHTENYFDKHMKEPNNTHQITVDSGSFMKSVPPTNKVLGKSAAIMIIDEAANLDAEDPDKFFKKVVVPTTAETGGFIILSSTPEGVSGFFYDNFDPDDKFKEHEYERLWFSHDIYKDKTYQAHVRNEKHKAEREGKIKTWQQQYEAKFTVTEESFFDLKDIEEGVKDTPEYYEWNKTACAVGYDFGMKFSRTVITIRTMIGQEIIELFQYRSPPNFDINHLVNPEWEHSIQNLKNRYNLEEHGIIGDDCPQGDTTLRWMESHSGLPIRKFNFRSDQMSKVDGLNRNCVAYSYRARLKEGILKIPRWNERQQYEMKLVQEVSQKILITIKAPQGQLCDTIDSDMLASIPFLDMTKQGSFEFDFPDKTDTQHTSRYRTGREDNFKAPTEAEVIQMLKDGDLSGIQI